ncbi:hypothetical protein [Haliangium sp. UPWRP_2]|uniref:hypothetical protein n=1 Tax=Haliangium sp. UPWRP_2 TaxID=1931276 RepID=UPI0011B29AE9|nr:hypothetical protein [Haliangium sp. UPWRP_2]
MSQRSRPASRRPVHFFRRYLPLTLLAAASVLQLWSPPLADSAGTAGWPAGQVIRRALINCYHARDRGQPVDSPPASRPDGGGPKP